MFFLLYCTNIGTVTQYFFRNNGDNRSDIHYSTTSFFLRSLGQQIVSRHLDPPGERDLLHVRVPQVHRGAAPELPDIHAIHRGGAKSLHEVGEERLCAENKRK